MADARRAAIVTGGSRGIGLEIAGTLAREGYDLTLVARTEAHLAPAVEHVSGLGARVATVTGDLSAEGAVQEVVAAHRHAFGRLDVLVNSAGVGIGAPAGEVLTKHLDRQLELNLRAVILLYREAHDLLIEAAREHRQAWVITVASIAGKIGEPLISVYSATKAAVIAFNYAMNRELGPAGIRSIALCPGWVDTDMTDYIKDSIPPETMIQPADVAAAVRFALSLSPACAVPEIVFERTGAVGTSGPAETPAR